MGAHLATIDGASVSAFVRSLVTHKNGYWIGANHVGSTRKDFKWADGSDVVYTNWMDGQPNDDYAAYGHQDECVIAGFDSSTDEAWMDSPCYANTPGYVCSYTAGVDRALTAATCANGWSPSGAKCFQRSFVGNTWSRAEISCQRMGASAHLATIADVTQNTFVRDLLPSAFLWIGANSLNQADPLNYVNIQGSVLNYSNWFTGEPNNGNGDPNEKCAVIGLQGAADYHWYDVNCQWTTPHYVCATDPGAVVCPHDWHYAEGSCFYYDYYNFPMGNWFTGNAQCYHQGGMLAKITSANQNHLVREITQYNNPIHPEIQPPTNLVWIGVETSTDGSLRYADGSKNVSFTWFQVGEPVAGDNDDCMLMGLTGPLNNMWYDSPCMWAAPTYACSAYATSNGQVTSDAPAPTPASPTPAPIVPTPVPTPMPPLGTATVSFALPFSTGSYTRGPWQVDASDGTSAIMYWSFDKDQIYIGIAAQGEYVGFGLNPHGPGMAGADLFVCRKYGTQAVVSAVDFHADGRFIPSVDESQDWVTVAAGHANGVVWCEVSRSRWTCDDDDYEVDDLFATVHAIVAWSPAGAVDDRLAFHGSARRKTLPFNFNIRSVSVESDAQTFSIDAPTVTVDTTSGSYACSYHVMPIPNPTTTRYHVVQYRVKQGGQAYDAGVCHHVALMQCWKPLGFADGSAVNCDDTMADCTTVMVQDGYNGGVTLPSDRAIPIGMQAGGATPIQYVVISRHFYNAANLAGLQDTGTGYDITFTPTLRSMELTMIAIGSPVIQVPANSYGVRKRYLCSSDCTTRMGTVHVSLVSIHMHAIAKSASLRQVRSGVELAPIADFDPYDAWLSTVATNVEVRAGDSLYLDCVYDNPGASAVVYGPSWKDEMCFAFVVIAGTNVGARICYDLPDGIAAFVPLPSACSGWENWGMPRHACNFSIPRSQCPDINDPSADQLFYNDVEKAAGFTPYVQGPHMCPMAPNMVSVPVAGIAGGCKTGSTQVDGAVDCGLSAGVNFRVRYSTHCDTNIVSFTFEADIVAPAWVAVGIADAGTADSGVARPAAAAAGVWPIGTDIVAVSTAGTILDGQGANSTSPVAKASPVATYSGTTFTNGRSGFSFTRPFASATGLTLQHDRFLWLTCAYRTGSASFDDHYTAYSEVPHRVSVFDGVASSYKQVMRSSLPTPAPTPTEAPTPAPSTTLAPAPTTAAPTPSPTMAASTTLAPASTTASTPAASTAPPAPRTTPFPLSDTVVITRFDLLGFDGAAALANPTLAGQMSSKVGNGLVWFGNQHQIPLTPYIISADAVSGGLRYVIWLAAGVQAFNLNLVFGDSTQLARAHSGIVNEVANLPPLQPLLTNGQSGLRVDAWSHSTTAQPFFAGGSTGSNASNFVDTAAPHEAAPRLLAALALGTAAAVAAAAP